MSSPENTAGLDKKTLSAGNAVFWKAVKRQFFYKVKINLGRFCGLLILQLTATLLSLGGAYNAASSTGNLQTITTLVSYQLILIVSLIWVVFFSRLLAGRADRKLVFTLPGNRLSDVVSDIGGILAVCAAGVVSASLFYAAMRLECLLPRALKPLSTGYYLTPGSLFYLAAGFFLYMLIAASVGYLIGTLERLHRALLLCVPGLIVLSLCPIPQTGSTTALLVVCSKFLFENGSLSVLLLKTVAAAFVLFLSSAVLCNRMEVRR